jgi:hypothetical protein
MRLAILLVLSLALFSCSPAHKDFLLDNFQGWEKITCPFSEFFARGDWQPQNADKNAVLNFPVKSFQFEPRPDSGTKQGKLYFDCVEPLR